MSTTPTSLQAWKLYCEAELTRVVPLLAEHGYVIDNEQPHTLGERYLMQAVTTESGRKLIILGTRKEDGLRVVIKATSDPSGIRELTHEQACRNTLHTIGFAYNTFHSPKEILTMHRGATYIVIQQFIPQDSTFLERPIEEQFTYALASLKSQESTHATTHSHIREIQNIFESYTADMYLHTFSDFVQNIHTNLPQAIHIHDTLAHAKERLRQEQETIEQYCGFLTHTDFVPHNFRIHNGTLHLLDFSSLRFGNKHESWARFMNFMTLYNPDLERALDTYVHTNRAPEECHSLTLMRIYRLGEIIWYYVRISAHSEGDLHTLNRARVDLWTALLSHTLNNEPLPNETRLAYIAQRDSLRSKEEKKRQKGLH